MTLEDSLNKIIPDNLVSNKIVSSTRTRGEKNLVKSKSFTAIINEQIYMKMLFLTLESKDKIK